MVHPTEGHRSAVKGSDSDKRKCRENGDEGCEMVKGPPDLVMAE